MHTTETNAKNNPIANNAKDIAVPPAKKVDGASMVPQAVDKAKEPMMPAGQKASADQPADKNWAHKVQDGSTDRAASTVSAKKDSSTPNALPKATDQRNAHR